MQRVLLPLVCLVVGTALGWWINEERDHAVATVGQQTGSGSPAKSEAKVGAAATAKTDEAKVAKEDEEKSRSLMTALDTLLEEYSEKGATKVMEGLSFDDIQRGLSYLAGKPQDYTAQALRNQLLRAWAKSDPQAAWKAALAAKDDDERTASLGAVAGEIAKSNPPSAIQLAMSLGIGSARTEVLHAVFGDWGKVNLGAAIAYLNSHPELPVDTYMMSNAIYNTASKDPALAAQSAISITSPEQRSNAIASALRQWVGKDTAAALRWAQGLTDPVLRDEAMKSLVQSLARKNVPQALETLKLIASPEDRQSALRNVLSSWMRRDPAAAMDYVVAQGSASSDSNLSWTIGYALENLTTAEQASLLARMPEGEMKNRAVSSMAQNYLYKGRYAQAVAALNTLPDSSERDSNLHNLGQQWGKKEPKVVANWLNAQADSSDRDLIVAGYSTALAGNDPRAALQWAGTIPDKRIQETAYRNIAYRWYALDAKAALAWVNSTPFIPEAEKKTFVINAPKRSNSTYIPSVSNRR